MLDNEVKKWISETLSQPNEIFGGLPPCPYARKAWADGKVKIITDTFTYDYDKLISGETIPDIGIIGHNNRRFTKKEILESIKN